MNLQTLGHAAAIFQRDPRLIEVALRAIGAKPKLVLNGIAHYLADEVVAAIAWLAEHDARQALESSREAAGNG